MEIVQKFELGNTKLEIFIDDDADSPRSWSNLSKMICHHKRYNLGDKHDFKHSDYNSLKELTNDIIRKEKTAIIVPLYMYEHSGITISLTEFSCRWDSGQVGFVIVTKEALRKEYNVKRITNKVIEKAMKVVESEVEVYNQYLTGDVYGFTLSENGEQIDSCGGFFGSDVKTNGILDNINNVNLVKSIRNN